MHFYSHLNISRYNSSPLDEFLQLQLRLDSSQVSQLLFVGKVFSLYTDVVLNLKSGCFACCSSGPSLSNLPEFNDADK